MPDRRWTTFGLYPAPTWHEGGVPGLPEDTGQTHESQEPVGGDPPPDPSKPDGPQWALLSVKRPCPKGAPATSADAHRVHHSRIARRCAARERVAAGRQRTAGPPVRHQLQVRWTSAVNVVPLAAAPAKLTLAVSR